MKLRRMKLKRTKKCSSLLGHPVHENKFISPLNDCHVYSKSHKRSHNIHLVGYLSMRLDLFVG